MKKVFSPGLKGLFKYQSTLGEILDLDREFSVFNSFTFIFFLGGLLILLGLFHREAFFMGISILISLISFYFIVKVQSESISISRIIPKRGTEYQTLSAKIILSNHSPFPLLDYQIIDSFSGNQKGTMSITPYKKVVSGSRRIIKMDWKTDGGMGEKSFKGLILELRDSLDLFSFQIYEDKEQALPIYPHFEKIPSLPVEFNENSFHYGEIDVQKRGESINFMGIRDYRKGDAIKRINWRQTARQSKPIVNVFERNVNKSIILLYNNALELHSGRGAQATEEYCKDLILALAAENISNGNQLKLITQNIVTPWGAEKAFINRLELFLLDLKLTSVPHPEDFVRNSIIRSEKEGINQSSLFYFTPLLAHPNTEKTFEDIIQAKARGIPFKVFGINPYSYVDKFFHYGSFSGVKGHIVATEKLIEKWFPLFRQNNIPFYTINLDPKKDLNTLIEESRRSFAGKI
ncbi:MAG: DUF58 domain-containing protein [Halobacteriovoraceae bacterium]|nr:DUF58 domain-containing protein [Halobacteriovoraceae bacterium]